MTATAMTAETEMMRTTMRNYVPEEIEYTKEVRAQLMMNTRRK